MVNNWKRLSATVAEDTIAILAKNRRTVLIYGAIIAFLALLPLLEPLTDALGRLLKTDFLILIIVTLLFISLTQSWNILSGYAGQINLGHAAFFGLGALTTRLLWVEQGVPIPIAFLAGGAIALLFALIIGLPAFRLRGIYFIIGTLALAEILRITVGNVYIAASRLPPDYLAGYGITPRYYLFLGLAAVVVATAYVMSRSRLGMGMKAVREDEDTAEASGVDALKYKMVAFGISAIFAGLAGAAFAFWHVAYYHYTPFHPVSWTFVPVMMVFVGGVGTVIGPILGAVFYVVFSRVLAVNWPGEVHLIVFGALFLLVVFFFPGGLIQLLEKVRRWLWPAKKEESKQA